MKGFTANPGGRPLSAVTELRARYSRRVPAIFDELMKMATDNSQPPMVQLAAIRLALEYLLGRPAISIDAVHTKVDIGQTVRDMYKNAMIRAGQALKHADGATDGGNSINGSVDAASE
jgi:hypothetical protein